MFIFPWCALRDKLNMSVADVIECVGFKNHTHFYGMFKDEFGILPGEYKRVHGHRT